MRIKKIAAACGATLLVLPAIALAGVKPPEDTSYAETGSTTLAVTKADKDSNGVAEEIDLTIGIFKCDNNVPFSINNVKIKKDATYAFKGKAKNFAGQKANLTVKGKFKSAKKIVQKTTIKSGNCKESDKAKLTRQG